MLRIVGGIIDRDMMAGEIMIERYDWRQMIGIIIDGGVLCWRSHY
jgi:hypothetical protein